MPFSSASWNPSGNFAVLKETDFRLEAFVLLLVSSLMPLLLPLLPVLPPLLLLLPLLPVLPPLLLLLLTGLLVSVCMLTCASAALWGGPF
jgi:hypothetical protein